MIYRRSRSKLVVDSEEQRRMEEQEIEEEERERLRKQQQRQRKIKREMNAQLREKVKDEITKMIGQPQQSLFEEDSDSGDSFQQVNQKIKLLYPNVQPIQPTQPQHFKRQQEVSQPESESSQSCKEQPQTQSINKPAQRMIARKRKMPQLEVDQAKESLIKQLAVRWWYAMPKWPPSDLDYRKLLRNKGFDLIDQGRYRFQESVVKGLTKACPIPGYEGIFKTPNRILDLRPKQTCPSLLNLRKKTTPQLQQLLSSALSNQLSQLTRVPHKTKDELALVCELEQRIGQL